MKYSMTAKAPDVMEPGENLLSRDWVVTPLKGKKSSVQRRLIPRVCLVCVLKRLSRQGLRRRMGALDLNCSLCVVRGCRPPRGGGEGNFLHLEKRRMFSFEVMCDPL